MLRLPHLQGDAQAALRHWWEATQPLNDPDAELDGEAFATVLAAYLNMRRAGVEIDSGLAAIIRVLLRQAFHSGMDADSDSCVTDGAESGNDDDADITAGRAA